MSKRALYEEARRLRIAGRSTMTRAELERAVELARHPRRPSRASLRFRDPWAAGVAFLIGLSARRPRSLALLGGLAGVKSLLPASGPLRAVLLSTAALAAGVLGLIVAYGVVPGESGAAQQASTLRLVTVTGPEGTTTLAITKTKEGKTKLVPVRVLRTVTGPGGVSTLSIAIAGPAITQIRDHTQTQVVENTVTEEKAVTDVVTQTQFEPVTVVVHDTETVVITDTVVVEVTVSGPGGPGP
jgi:hypothetical protein